MLKKQLSLRLKMILLFMLFIPIWIMYWMGKWKNGETAGLEKYFVLSPKENTLKKAYSLLFRLIKLKRCAMQFLQQGAGHIGNYSECSFNAEGDWDF